MKPLQDDIWRLSLPTYAYMASNNQWQPWQHSVFAMQCIQQAVQRGNGRLILNWPPRHGKTYSASYWAPAWFLDLYPDKQVIFASYGADFAASQGRKVRDLVRDNPAIWTKPHPKSTKVNDWNTTQGGGFKTAGVDGPLTGRGGDLIIVDDPHKDWAEATSQTARNKVIEWFGATLYTRLEPNATIIVIQTRWHEEDLTGYLTERHSDNWDHLRFPALAEEDDILGRAPGEALCPERFSRERLLAIKAALKMTPTSWDGLYQQRPTNPEGEQIQRAWVHRYAELPDHIDDWCQSWDLTFKKQGSAYVSGQVWAKAGANAYLIDEIRGKMSFTETLDAIKTMTRRYPHVTKKVIEDAANAQATHDILKDVVPGILLKRPKGTKESRFDAVSVLFKSGNIYIPQNRMADDWLDEIVAFPKIANKDRVDTTSLALAEMFQSLHADYNIRLAISGGRESPWGFARMGATQ